MKRILISIIELWILGFIGFVLLVGNLNQNSSDLKADAAIVLTGGHHRIEEGIKILDKNHVKKLFITGVDSKVRNIDEITNASVDAKPNIEYGQNATNTFENAIEAKEWILHNNINSIVLITANYHIPRSMLEFRSLLPNIKITPYPVYPTHDMYKKSLLYFTEYNKSIYVLIKNLFT